MLPVLKLASEGREHKLRDAVKMLADEFQLTPDERSDLLPSGGQPVFNNRVAWARTYLKQAGLLVSPKRGFFVITKRGIELLSTNPSRVDISVLEQYSEFVEFRNRRKSKESRDSRNNNITPIRRGHEPNPGGRSRLCIYET